MCETDCRIDWPWILNSIIFVTLSLPCGHVVNVCARKSHGRDCIWTFSSPEPVFSWSRGRETRGSGSSRYRMSENFWHPVARVQKFQISLLMLITDFCPSPLHWGKNFTSWALSRELLFWDVLKMQHFTQLGFTYNLELKEEDSNRNRLNTLSVCRTETINRQTIVWVTWVFFSIRLANKHWESNITKIDIMREKVNLKR